MYAGGLVCVALLGSALVLLLPSCESSTWFKTDYPPRPGWPGPRWRPSPFSPSPDPVVPTASTASSSSTASRCDPAIIDRIEQYWCKFGRPGNNMGKAFDKIFIAASRSPINLNRGIDCLYYTMPSATTRGDSSIATWHYVLANGTEFSQSANMTERCGKLYVQEIKRKVYVIRYHKGVYLLYVCSMDESAPYGPPAYEIYVKETYNTAAYKECKENLAEYFNVTKLEDSLEGCYTYFDTKRYEVDDYDEEEEDEYDEYKDDEDRRRRRWWR